MKGKAILVVFSLIVCAMATYQYFTRSNFGVTVRADAESPKISIFGYEFYRFKDDLVVSRLAGEKAALFDGGRIEMTEGLRTVRINGQRREELSSRRADVYLASSTQGSLSSVDKIEKINVKESVDLMVGAAHLETEDATYTENDATIRSTVPVRMEQTGNFLAGEQGFEFNMKQETLKMKGGITGTVLPAAIKTETPKGAKK